VILGSAAFAVAPRVAAADAMPNAGFDPRLLAAVAQSFNQSTVDFHGLLVERHGQVALEVYRTGRDQPLGDLTAHDTVFTADTLHDLRGISRSITVLLWGIAQGEGRTPPLDTPVLDLYPKLAKYKNNGREGIRVRHLLNMSAGLRWTEAGPKGDAFGLTWHPDPLDFVFDRPMVDTPGNLFNDCSGCTLVLADILAGRVGMSLVDYANTRLFGPLGITTFEWRKDMLGRVRAYDGLRLKPRDLLHIGRMVAWGGQWQGYAIVPADLIAASMKPLINTRQPKLAPQYGYGWWSGPGLALGHPLRWQAAVGGGANRLFLIPDLDLVMVTTAGNYDDLDDTAQRLFEHVVGAARS
jgi:CubicO group peptidase (beta-lactamase class C family)